MFYHRLLEYGKCIELFVFVSTISQNEKQPFSHVAVSGRLGQYTGQESINQKAGKINEKISILFFLHKRIK